MDLVVTSDFVENQCLKMDGISVSHDLGNWTVQLSFCVDLQSLQLTFVSAIKQNIKSISLGH